MWGELVSFGISRYMDIILESVFQQPQPDVNSERLDHHSNASSETCSKYRSKYIPQLVKTLFWGIPTPRLPRYPAQIQAASPCSTFLLAVREAKHRRIVRQEYPLENAITFETGPGRNAPHVGLPNPRNKGPCAQRFRLILARNTSNFPFHLPGCAATFSCLFCEWQAKKY